MGLYLGNSEVKKVYLGSNEVPKIYLGSNLIYQNNIVSVSNIKITLTSNQGWDINTTIDISGSINKSIEYNASPITVQAPTNEELIINPQPIEGHRVLSKSITPVSSNEEVNILYESEQLSVSGALFDGSQITDIDVEVEGYGSKRLPATYYIAYGEKYTIIPQEKQGYYTPDKASFTASATSRSVKFTYRKPLEINEAPSGVYILRTDNLLYPKEIWNTTWNNEAVGVALITSNYRVIISSVQENRYLWAKDGIAEGIQNVSRASDESAAKEDYNGIQNTTNLVARYGTAEYSASYCQNYTFKNGKKGYLGSTGEWYTIYSNRSKINNCLTLINGSLLDTSYWTSTQASSNNEAWIIMFGVVGGLSTITKNNYLFVRPLAELD